MTEKAPDFSSEEVQRIILPGSDKEKIHTTFSDEMLSGYSATVLADSSSDDINASRLTTMIVRFPRCILSEVNTHRTLCLAGDAELEFDLPSERINGGRRPFSMTIEEFVNKWHNGAAFRASNPKRELDLSWMKSGEEYTAPEIAEKTGYTKHAINFAARKGHVEANRGEDGRVWVIKAEDFKKWREDEVLNSQPIQYRLSEMNIRQVDENTGKIVNSTVKDCVVSGEKEVFEVKAGDFTVAGSKDHLVYTSEGYVRIEDIVPGETEIIVRAFGKQEDDINDPYAHKKINGRWRTVWQRQVLPELVEKYGGCVDCGASEGIHVHHIEPVHKRPDLAFEIDNVEPVCEDHHIERHRVQEWQGGTYLYGKPVVVDDVSYRGVEQTYDLEIEGEFPNFVANGVVVHNSRNSASSRARSMKTTIREIMEDPYIPLFTKNQRGMGGKYLTEAERDRALPEWLDASHYAVTSALSMLLQGTRYHDEVNVETIDENWERLVDIYNDLYLNKDESILSPHKQNVNRILEPFMWHEAIISATDWENFYYLRDHEEAQPEIRAIARLMKEAMDASIPLNTNYHVPFEDEFYLAAADADDSDIKGAGLEGLLNKYNDYFMSSAGDCARVSYKSKLDQGSTDSQKLGYRLLDAGHLSPFEHVAVSSLFLTEYAGASAPSDDNFDKGWTQFRTLLADKG